MTETVKCPKCGAGMDAWGCVRCGNTTRPIENPAWDYVERVGPDPLFAGLGPGYSGPQQMEIKRLGSESPEIIGHRSRVTSRWTWAIPSPNIIDSIVRHLDGRPVVELGAGNGYWAWLLTQMGVDVRAYDAAPIGHKDSWFSKDTALDHYKFEIEEFFPVKLGSTEVLEQPDNANRVLFLCWPNYNTSFAYDAVKAFQGDTVIYIGERGGCNANEDFFALMEGYDYSWRDDDVTHPDQEWEVVHEEPMVQWSGLHDLLVIYKRTSTA